MPEPFVPFGSPLSQQENPWGPAAVGASGRRVHRGRAVSAGRLIARLRRPLGRGSRRRCDAEQDSTAPRPPDGRREKRGRSECKPPWISRAPPICAWTGHLHAFTHTAPRGCGVSARYNPDLMSPRCVPLIPLGAQVLRPFSLNCGGLRRPRGRLSPPRPAGDGGRRFFAHANYLLLVIGARTAPRPQPTHWAPAC